MFDVMEEGGSEGECNGDPHMWEDSHEMFEGKLMLTEKIGDQLGFLGGRAGITSHTPLLCRGFCIFGSATSGFLSRDSSS